MWNSASRDFEKFLKPDCLLRCFNQIQNWTFVNSSDDLEDNVQKTLCKGQAVVDFFGFLTLRLNKQL